MRALDAQAVGGFTGFSIEQVYVNVPELDVFVTAQDDTGSPIDPMLVQAAGVELYIGEEKIPTGNIGMASEPICYLVVIDNSTAILKDDLAAVRGAVRTLIKNKGERDQIALYTTAGGPACVLPATDDGAAAMRALSGIRQAAGELDVTSLVTSVYSDVNAAYQSLAPRKCLLLFTDIMQTAANPALLAGLAGDASEQLNMAMTAFAVGQPEEKEAVGMGESPAVSTPPAGAIEAIASPCMSARSSMERSTFSSPPSPSPPLACWRIWATSWPIILRPRAVSG